MTEAKQIITRIIESYGSYQACADELGLGGRSVPWNWEAKGEMPPVQQIRLFLMGRLSRKELEILAKGNKWRRK